MNILATENFIFGSVKAEKMPAKTRQAFNKFLAFKFYFFGQNLQISFKF
jgi:hypothetical protein